MIDDEFAGDDFVVDDEADSDKVHHDLAGDDDPNRAPACNKEVCRLPDCFCSEDGTEVQKQNKDGGTKSSTEVASRL